jgi:hypothetical protein
VVSKRLALAALSAAAVTVVMAIALAPSLADATTTPGCPPGYGNRWYCSRPEITATMQWTFFFAPRYTRVVLLQVNGASLTTVRVRCSGRGCPYPRQQAFVSRYVPCGRHHQFRCPTHGTLNLTGGLRRSHLSPGVVLSVAITRWGWIGKYYVFTIRGGKPPLVGITCLPPGRSQPNGAC